MFGELREAAEGVAAEVLTREDFNSDRDQFLKGFLRGIDESLGWRPEFIEQQMKVKAIGHRIVVKPDPVEQNCWRYCTGGGY